MRMPAHCSNSIPETETGYLLQRRAPASRIYVQMHKEADMGNGATYRCTQCGYSATVSGGHDCGFVAVVRTRFCTACRELVDVLVGRYGQDGPTGDPLYDKDLNCCPMCRGNALRDWNTEDPCPRCGGSMNVEPGSQYLWD